MLKIGGKDIEYISILGFVFHINLGLSKVGLAKWSSINSKKQLIFYCDWPSTEASGYKSLPQNGFDSDKLDQVGLVCNKTKEIQGIFLRQDSNQKWHIILQTQNIYFDYDSITNSEYMQKYSIKQIQFMPQNGGVLNSLLSHIYQCFRAFANRSVVSAL